MKRKLSMTALACVAAAAMAMTTTSCMTGDAARHVSGAIYIAGSDFATWQLGKDPNSLKGLVDLAAALPDIPLGKATPYQMGVLNRELFPLQKAASAIPKDAAALTRIGNIISAASQQLSGEPTIITGAASAHCANFANGIKAGIQFWQGQKDAEGAK